MILALYSVFLTTSFFTTTGVVSNFPISNLSTSFFKLLKPLGTFFNLSIYNLSTLDFKLAKSTFSANFDVSKPVAIFKYDFVA